jgi:heme/copper-type cytochrome/quinol oxidase subunit 1
MNIHKIKIYHSFYLIAIIILSIGIYYHFVSPDGSLDINIHDTYFVFPHSYVTFLLSVSYYMLGLGYWSVQKHLNKKLMKPFTVIHSVILIGSFILYWFLILYNGIFFDESLPLHDSQQYINETLVISFLLIVFVAQPAYLANLIFSIFRKRN